MRALSKFICSAERLFSNWQLTLKSLKHNNAISFNLVLKRSFSLVVIDKSKVLLYKSSNSVIIARQSPLERRSLSLDDNS